MDDQANSKADSDYQAVRKALLALNEYVKDYGVENRRQLPTSYRGNPKPLAAKSLAQKIWVAGHGSLRDFTSVIGGLLDIDALEDAPHFKVAYQDFVQAQKIYQKAGAVILEDAQQYIATHPNVDWDGYHHGVERKLNARGQPVVEILENLGDLRQHIFSQDHDRIWEEFDAADAGMNRAMGDVMGALDKQKTVPLKWVDAKGVTQRASFGRQVFYQSAAVCKRLLSYAIIERYGQLNMLTASSETTAALYDIGETNMVASLLDFEVLSPIRRDGNASLKQYISDEFRKLPSVHKLDALRNDPIARATFRMDSLKDAFDPLRIDDYPEKATYSDDARSAPGVCPVTHGNQANGDRVPPSDSYWSEAARKGCPAARGGEGRL